MMLTKKAKAKIKHIQDKLPHIVNRAITAALNAKINQVKKKMPNITNLGSCWK